MNNIKFALLALVTMTILSCTGTTTGRKSLILYYSQTGTTKAVADILQQKLGADIECLEVENPYSGTFEETIVRCQQEMAANELPEVKALKADLSQYDTLYLGYPVWMGTFARPMLAFLSNCSLQGKVIIPFCTFGSGGLVETTEQLKACQPKATVLPGYGVRTARLEAVESEVERFLCENHYIVGDVEALPPYSEQQPVTAEETAIFVAACASYPYPLGTPVTASSRITVEGTDYAFRAEALSMSGEKSIFTVWITFENGKEPVFTRVDR